MLLEKKTATLSDTNWSCDFTFDGDYEVELEAFAYDAMQNGSDDSHQRIMVLIDSQDPTIGDMDITRNGKYISKLITLEDFTTPGTGKTAQKDKPENKDFFQNESFVLSTNLKDNYGIEEVYMDIYEVDASSKTETLVLEKIEPDSTDNLYVPSFTITEQMLVKGKTSLASGLHYLKPYIYTKDAAGNEPEKKEYKILAWEPEYNTPHISFNAYKDGIVEITQGASIIVSIFDDDDLKNYSYTLVKRSEYEAAGKTINDFIPKDAKGIKYMKTLESGLRDTAIEISTEDKNADYVDFDGNELTLGRYYLVIRVEDTSGRGDGVYFKSTLVKIKNEDAPTVFVDTPDENSVPNLSKTAGHENKFTITGRVSDNENSVKIAIAWLGPETSSADTTKKIRAAETYFEESYGFTAPTGSATYDTYGTGKIWFLGEQTDSTPKSSYEYNWSKEFDFFNDFKNGSATDNTNKVFVIAAQDPTGNVTTQTFRMSKFTSTPTFEIKYTPSGEEAKTALNPVVVLEPKTVTFEITPKTSNNMPIESCTLTPDSATTGYSITKNWTTDKYFEFTVENPASGKIMNFDLYVKDKIGGETKQSLTLQFNVVGKLQNVDCNWNPANYFTKGDVIKIQVIFEGSQISCSYKGTIAEPEIEEDDGSGNKVKKVMMPYIQLSGIGLSERIRAYCTTPSGQKTNTLYFEYKVPEGIEATQLQIDATNESNLIKGTYTPGWQTGGTFDITTFNTKEYKIDSIAPHITTYSTKKSGNVVNVQKRLDPTDPTNEKKKTKYIELLFTFNEPVFVESGTIVMQRTANWYIPPVLSNDVFVSIWNEADAGERRILCGSADKTYEYGKDPNGIDTLIAQGPYMQFTNGLDLDDTTAIPDISTKYVLAYNYYYSSGSFNKENPENLAIGATTGTVAKIRQVLETHNYHKTSFEVTDVTDVSGNPIDPATGSSVIKITVSDENFIGGLVNGVEYFLTLTADSFRDAAYNYYKGTNKKVTENEKEVVYGIAPNDYEFWVGPVATPVIRVNRTATNIPTTSTTRNESVTSEIMKANKPTAKTSIRIDCETPRATVRYIVNDTKKVEGQIFGTYTGVGEYRTNYGEITKLRDIETKTLKGLTANTPAAGENPLSLTNGTVEIVDAVGDGSLKTAQKIYIKATASAAIGSVSMGSADGYEGAFKTIIHCVEPGRYNAWDTSNTDNYYQGDDFRIYGAQIPEGGSYTSGWPLTQNGTEHRSDWQVAWKDADGEVDSSVKNSYYWLSWQILTNFTLQTIPGNYGTQEPANPRCTYGQYIYYYREENWQP